MNVYDFDKTVYNGDSTLDFFIFSLKQQPTLLLLLPKQLYGFILYKLRVIDKTKFKDIFYCFVPKISELDKLIEKFWKQNGYKVMSWYKAQQAESDIVISASPFFLLEPICKELKINHLIASNIDVSSGKNLNANCYGEEKVLRFRELFSDAEINNFYSDSLSDTPLAEIAKNSFIVLGDKQLVPWEKYRKQKACSHVIF